MTEIDSLTVGVGLTQEDFDAGVKKILASLGSLRTQTEATGESMTSSLSSVGSSVLGLGMKFAGLFVAVKGMEDVVGYFKQLSTEMSNLNVASEYLGQSASELSRFGQVAQLAGGQAQDAITAAQSLQSAIFGLEFQGQMSQNLLMLQRLGVGYLDAGGHMRDMKDIALETAKALQQQLPGQANEAMRVQYAATIFGAGGIANAVGGPLADFRAMYAKAVSEQKNITDKAAAGQRRLQQHLIDLSYVIKNDAVKALEHLTPQIEHLVGAIRNELIPTIDEAIGDLMDFMHPQSLADKVASGKGVGPLGFTHPINTFEAIGIGLGISAGQIDDWWEKHRISFNTAGSTPIPPEVQSRLAPGTNMEALGYLHYEAGGDIQDPTWSKAVAAYAGLQETPGGPAAYVQYVHSSGTAQVPSHLPYAHALPLHALSTPSVRRPAPASPSGARPTASTRGPRVTIGDINIQTQATDASGIAASINRALERKLLVSQSDPGLA